MPSSPEEQASRAVNLHQSGLDTILGCSRKYFLETLLALPAQQSAASDVGTALHSALEMHERRRLNGEAPPEQDEFVAYGLVALEKLTESYLGDLEDPEEPEWKLRAAAKNFYEAALKGTDATLRETVMAWQPLSIEWYGRAQVVNGTRPLAGTADAVYETPDVERRFVVVDWKTAKNFNYWPHDGKGHREQAVHYSVLATLDESLPMITSLPPVYFAVARTELGSTKAFEGSRGIWLQPDLLDVRRLSNRVLEAQSVIDAGVYPPNPEYKWCKTCPFRTGCQETGELGAPVAQVQLQLGKRAVA